MKRAIVAGIGWLSSSVMLQALVNLLAIGILARLLAPTDFGIAAIIMIVVGVATPLAQFGFAQAYIRSDHHSIYATAYLLSLITAVPISILAFTTILLLPPLSDEAIWLAVMAAGVVLVRAVSTVSEALLFRLHRLRTVAISEVAGQVVFLAFSVFTAWVGFGAAALVVGYLAQAAARYLVCLAGGTRLPEGLRRIQIRSLFRFGFGYTLARSGNVVAKEIDKAVIGAKLGEAALGLYSRAQHLAVMAPTVLGQVTARVLYPIYSEYRSDMRLVYRNYRLMTVISTAVGALAAIWVAILAPVIIRILLGPSWLDIVPAFQWLLLGIPARLAYKVADPVLKAYGRVYLKAALQWVYAVITGALVLIGARFGLEGVAIGAITAVCIHCFAIIFFAGSCLAQTRMRSIQLAFFALVCVCIVSLVPLATLFWVYFFGNQIGWVGSIVVGIATTLLLLLATQPHKIIRPQGKPERLQ